MTAAAFMGLGSNSAIAMPMYEITVTNVTKAVSFTPILVASHNAGVSLGRAGGVASTELAELAEDGVTARLQSVLDANDSVRGTATSTGLLAPGQSVTIQVPARRARYLSLASMVVPTNDTFIWVDSLQAPRRGNQTVTAHVYAYDSGTEVNDELCENIAGPAMECPGGAGAKGKAGSGEGFIHIANGIQGSGDLMRSMRDWRGPVAEVRIVRR